jgi:hypothetical protein
MDLRDLTVNLGDVILFVNVVDSNLKWGAGILAG